MICLGEKTHTIGSTFQQLLSKKKNQNISPCVILEEMGDVGVSGVKKSVSVGGVKNIFDDISEDDVSANDVSVNDVSVDGAKSIGDVSVDDVGVDGVSVGGVKHCR